ncbi:MAG: hypothetical protein GY913_32970 [Proteobacteria bacterium]|nr:hypothetical protein [Pseudomonadota bacterium]MCP4921737.1 hypothetical protein [Pseudomonadota bacterium]
MSTFHAARFQEAALSEVQPADVADRIRTALSVPGRPSLSDSEKLHIAVRILDEAGLTGGELAAQVALLFFEPCPVRDVFFLGGEVRVEFDDDRSYSNPAPAPEPVESRSERIEGFRKTGSISRPDTWLQREHLAVVNSFLATWEGERFARLTPSQRTSDAAFRRALWMFEQDLAVSYLLKAKAAVKRQLGPVRGRSAEQLLSDAIDLAQQYKNPYVHAAPHAQVEIQDEAVAMGAVEELGFPIADRAEAGS